MQDTYVLNPTDAVQLDNTIAIPCLTSISIMHGHFLLPQW